MDRDAREVVRLRANGRCEYCGLRQSQAPLLTFHVEHIRARQHRGDDSPENACLACPSCNLHQGPNQSAFDPITGALVQLFHPRHDVWSAHFRDDDGEVTGVTPTGRATVALLEMNHPELVRMRQIVEEQDD